MVFKKKALVVTTVASTIDQFCMNDISILHENYEVEVAANFAIGNNTSLERIHEFKRELKENGIKINEIEFSRKPLSKSNIVSYKELKKLIENKKYEIIHCHTPVAAMITRLASRAIRKKGTKVIYTAHGFHFHKGAPLKNWLIYYPIEKWLFRYTDCLITINQEDYEFAINKKFKAKRIKYIHGVGVDLNEFEVQNTDKKMQIRKEYGYKEEDFILFYAAELNSNKHQDLLINVIKNLKEKIPNIKLLLAGNGILENQYKEQIQELELNSNIEFLGFRRDIKNLLMLSDIAVASSRREGLPVNVMEAMATGLPLVVTDVRGHRDLVKDSQNGFIVAVDDVGDFSDSIERLYQDDELRYKFGKKSIKLVQEYSLENVLKEMEDIYELQLGGNQ